MRYINPVIYKKQTEEKYNCINSNNIDKILKGVRGYDDMKRAVNFGIVGLGQCGNRLASEFAEFGYPTIVINTSEQDLVDIKCDNKLCIGDGGAGRDLKIGAEAINLHRAEIMSVYQKVFTGVEHIIVCAGSSGGTGGGGLANIIDTVLDFKKPCGVITTFPLFSEDTRCKKNTLAVLNDLVKLSIDKKISPLILIDNDKIEKKYPGLSTSDFWLKANKEVVKCFHLFNVLAARNSKYVSFDPANYKKVLFSGGCMIFGNVSINPENMTEDTIAIAIKENLNSGLLAEGFNLIEATHAAFIVMSSKEKLSTIPMKAAEKANSMLMESIGSGTVFKGVYEIDTTTNIEIIMMLSGLGLPKLRIKEIIKTAKEETQHLEKKVQLKTVDDILKELEEGK